MQNFLFFLPLECDDRYLQDTQSLYHPNQAGGVSDMHLTGRLLPTLIKNVPKQAGSFPNSALDAAGIKSTSADVKRLIRLKG